MKKIILISFCLAIGFFSCSTYQNQTAIERKSDLSNFKKSGLLIKTSKYNSKNRENHLKSLSFSLRGYEQNNKIKIISEASKSLSTYHSELDRFCQMSADKKLMKYKSIGAIKLYLLNNKKEFEEIFAKHKLDSLILFEVDSSYSVEVQFFDFEATTVIIDKNFNIFFLDYSSDTSHLDEIDEEKLQSFLFDAVNKKLFDNLVKFKYLVKKKN